MTLRAFFDRYGPTLIVAAALALIVALLPGNTRDTDRGGNGRIATEGAAAGDLNPVDGNVQTADGAAVGAAAAAGGSPAVAASKAAAVPGVGGSQVSKAVTDANCRTDGRMRGIAIYMPKCIPWGGGDNGGATARGVTKDTVKVVRYVNQVNPATEAILRGARLADDPAVVKRAYQAWFNYGNAHYNTYGRQVVFEDYPASGPDTDDEALKADAIRIANDIKPFAVITNDTTGPKPFAQELAQRGVMCLCTVSLSTEFYTSLPPLIFSALPTNTEHAIITAEYIGKRLKDRPAKWAGDDAYRVINRRFGLIYLEGEGTRVEPEGRRLRDRVVAELAKWGVTLSREFGYLYEPARNVADFTTIMAGMKASGVTTVILMVDPLAPIIFTPEATRQDYFPEWFITGTGLSDTSAAGRLYDQQQWAHAFGVSPLWVAWSDNSLSEGYREFHHGMPGMQRGDEGVLINIYRAAPSALFSGVHYAGPNLTNETFAQGLFTAPRTGGQPKTPLLFFTRQFPTAIKDFSEVWWGANVSGKDERNEQGTGMMMRVDGGKRFQLGELPTGEPHVFDPNGAIAISDDPRLGGPVPHEQDGHSHRGRCLTCT